MMLIVTIASDSNKVIGCVYAKDGHKNLMLKNREYKWSCIDHYERLF